MKKYAALAFITALLFISGCSGSINVTSQNSEGKTIVDGNTSEWKNLNPIKNDNIAVGFRNDKDFMYIALTTNDRNKIMKIITGGLELWLEPNDSDNKIGIRFPERPEPSEMMRIREQRRQMQESGQQAPPPDFLQNQTLLSIINDDGTVLKQFSINGTTYQAKIVMTGEQFSYELRVPIGLSQNAPDGLKTASGENVSVEFITGSFFRDMQRRGDGDGMRMGGGEGMGHGGPGGRGQGGPGGPGGGQRQRDFTPMNYTFDVKLQ